MSINDQIMSDDRPLSRALQRWSYIHCCCTLV